jgi:pilus assembly protein Flp/PilA
MLKMMVWFRQALWTVKNEKGASAIEYGLLAALISVTIITAAGAVGTGLENVFNRVANELTNALTP